MHKNKHNNTLLYAQLNISLLFTTDVHCICAFIHSRSCISKLSFFM